MTAPLLAVLVDDLPVAGLFFERLISLTVTDREGVQSDTIDLSFSDAPPHFASPRRGAVILVTLTTPRGVFVGRYVVDSVEHGFLPYTITVRGHAADQRGEMKTHKSRHWDDTSVKHVVEEVARDHGLDTRIAASVSDHVYPWLGQQDETDLSFLERLAKRHGALFTIKNGTLLWLDRGRGETAAGTGLAVTTIRTSDIVVGTLRLMDTDTGSARTVKANWQDRDSAARRSVEAEADPQADGTHLLRDAYGSEAEAQRAADAKAKDMARSSTNLTGTLVGMPGLAAGQPLAIAGVHPELDGQTFITEEVAHSYSKGGGLTTTFSGKPRAA